MDKRHVDSFQEALAKKFSRRAALAGLAGGGVAATLTLAGAGKTRGASAQTPSVAIPGAFGPAPAGTEILWDTWGVPAHLRRERPRALLRLRLGAGPQPRRPAAAALRPGPRPGRRVLRRRLPRPRPGRPDDGAARAGARSGTRRRPPDFRANLDAFAAGINAYAEQHPDRLDAAARRCCRSPATDVLAHVARIFFQFIGGESEVLDVLLGSSERGSNAWAVAPSHTADGHALLLANPHLPWGGEHTFFEAQLSAPGVYDAYGATLVGIPVLAIAFNDYLGWTHTVNTLDAADLYA